ncbi:MAG: hypothetical protein ABSA30_06785 [Candidatus Aminicenantales bacterium]
MINTMHRRGRTAAAWGLFVAVLLLLAAPARSDSGGEWDICRRAMLNCLGQGFAGGSSLGVFLRLEYCLAGYEFCRKYVMLYV